MNYHNFQLVNCDTDSISFCKSDGSFMPLEERKALIKDINDKSPEFMQWADDGYYKKVIIVKAKNYILQKENGELTYKGSAIKAPGKPLALREFIKKIIDLMLNDQANYLEVYNGYAKEILNVQDITRWADRKTLTSTTFESTRTNETKVMDAIQGTEYVEGNRIWTFFKSDKTLSLVENFDGDYDKTALLKKLYNTIEIFAEILDINQFPNYSLSKKTILKRYNVDLDNF